MFVSAVFLNQHRQQQQDNSISVSAFSTLWMDAVTRESCKPPNKNVYTGKAPETHHVYVIVQSFKWLFDESVVQLSQTQVESPMEGKQQRLTNAAKLGWFRRRQRRLDPQTERHEGRCRLKRPLQRQGGSLCAPCEDQSVFGWEDNTLLSWAKCR